MRNLIRYSSILKNVVLCTYHSFIHERNAIVDVHELEEK